MGEAKRRAEARREVALVSAEKKAAIADVVRNFEFDFGPGGSCWYRVVSGLYLLNTVLGLRADPCFGAMLYRCGPDPIRDVVAFCGPGNAGCWAMTEGGFLGHVWIRLGDDLIETPKDEREELAERLQNKFGLDIFYHEPPAKGQ